jgi:hypothetical protein
MKKINCPLLPLFLVLLFALFGCEATPEREIVSAFTAFLQDIREGDESGAIAKAPFLASLTVDERKSAIDSFSTLAGLPPGELWMSVSSGSIGGYVLTVRVNKLSFTLSVPFSRGKSGAWEIGPAIQATQRIDFVPAKPVAESQ